MLMMIKRILKISGAYSGKIKLGIFFNLMKTISMSLILIAVYVVAENLNHLTMNTVWSALGIVIVSILLRILFQWLMDITMSARGFDMFRDYRLTIGDRMRAAPMGYFSEQKLGSIQTVLTSTVTELEQYSMMAIMDLTGGVLMALAVTAFFLIVQPLFALITLVGLGLGMLILHIIQWEAVKHTPNVLAAQENMTIQALEYIRGISVLRAFSQADGSEGAVYAAFDRKRQADLDQEYASLPLLKIYSAVYKLTGCLMMFAAGRFVCSRFYFPFLLPAVYHQFFHRLFRNGTNGRRSIYGEKNHNGIKPPGSSNRYAPDGYQQSETGAGML